MTFRTVSSRCVYGCNSFSAKKISTMGNWFKMMWIDTADITA